VKHKRLFTLAAQLKAGKGLTIGCTVVQGQFNRMYGEAQAARRSLKQVAHKEFNSIQKTFYLIFYSILDTYKLRQA
jgi:hypothetical protein